MVQYPRLALKYRQEHFFLTKNITFQLAYVNINFASLQ